MSINNVSQKLILKNEITRKIEGLIQKVWTRLKTGLYGWRIERNGPIKPDLELKNRLKNFDSNLGESKAKINFKWVPETEIFENIPTISRNSQKRKLSDNLMGGENKSVTMKSKSGGLDNEPR